MERRERERVVNTYFLLFIIQHPVGSVISQMANLNSSQIWPFRIDSVARPRPQGVAGPVPISLKSPNLPLSELYHRR